jgi:multidrug efflux system membrane fusion protein
VKRTHLAAAAVAAVFVLWLLSGQLGKEDATGPAPSLAESRDAMMAMDEDAPTRVRARVVPASPQAREVVVRGRTEADRLVDVRAETSGRIAALPVEKGERVDTGDLLCRIAEDTRPARVEEAEQAVAQARIEFDGARRLAERGLQSETAIAAARARLASAEANLEQRRLDLEHTYVRAPFGGVVETRPVEIGDFLQAGGVCARVVDPDPMMLVGDVAERDVASLDVGDAGGGRLITGERVEGTIAFVARTADPTTRTFRVEVAVPNPDARLRDGITTEIRLPVERRPAHRIASGLLALDDAGDLGVRILDDDNVVRFVNVEVLRDEAGGVWVTGLPDPATVITVGQELVVPGQQVEATFEAGSSMPASAPAAPATSEQESGTADSGDPEPGDPDSDEPDPTVGDVAGLAAASAV